MYTGMPCFCSEDGTGLNAGPWIPVERSLLAGNVDGELSYEEED